MNQNALTILTGQYRLRAADVRLLINYITSEIEENPALLDELSDVDKACLSKLAVQNFQNVGNHRASQIGRKASRDSYRLERRAASRARIKAERGYGPTKRKPRRKASV